MNPTWRGTPVVGLVGVLLFSHVGLVQARRGDSVPQTHCTSCAGPGQNTPLPRDPFPLSAAGWGDVRNGLLASRWAEDWTGMRAAGRAPPLKAIPLAHEAYLTVSAEARLRFDSYNNGQLVARNDFEQGLFRAVLGADLVLNPYLRAYGEMATGQVAGRRAAAGPNFQNTAALQQLFVDARQYFGPTLVGAMVGRQEFSDGPKQLISLSDGPNIHRSWNGTRLYLHDRAVRLGAFDLRVTRMQRDAFDEEINHAERLRGVNASFALSPSGGPSAYLDSYWMRTENPAFRSGGRIGVDKRDTIGLRLWGKAGDLRFDWTLAHQGGQYIDRHIDAWGLFGIHHFDLAKNGWRPRLTVRIDVASGGAYSKATMKGFNQLYASSNYLGEGQFLSLSNLLMATPGIAFAPTPRTTLSLECGFAQRLKTNDAAYAGGMRAYPGSQNVAGRQIGNLFRVSGSWSASDRVTLFVNIERLVAGDVLRKINQASGSYGYFGATWRY